MLKAVEGIYRNGRVELTEQPEQIAEARVIVTFLPEAPRQSTELTLEEIAELRWRLEAWEEDWNAPGMEAYDLFGSKDRDGSSRLLHT